MDRLQPMSAADGGDLFGVMASVDEVEASPLADAEWAEDLMGDCGLVAEGSLGLVEDRVHCSECLMELL